MSRLRDIRNAAAALLVGALAVPGAPGPVVALQSTDDVEQRLMERLEAIAPRMERLRARADEAKRLSREARQKQVVRYDTAMVGRMRVVTRQGDLEEVVPVYREVWRDVGPWIGSAADLEEATFVFEHDKKVREGIEGPRYLTNLRRWQWSQRLRSRNRLLESRIRGNLGEHLRNSLPSDMAAWLDRAWLRPAAPERLYRNLVLLGAGATEACLVGETEGCWRALGLAPSGEYLGWFDESDLERAEEGRKLVGYERECRAEELELCDARWLYMPTYWSLGILMPGNARADLVYFALEQGGEGALDRLLDGWPSLRPAVEAWADETGYEGPTSHWLMERFARLAFGSWSPRYGPSGIDRAGRDGAEPDGERLALIEETGFYLPTFAREFREALARASGMSQDELMAAWRERLVEARPDLQAGAERTRATTFLWILFFTALAMRSTRWRLG